MIAVLGDTHGHLQLALCVLARWQEELGSSFETVFLCGDVGTFTDDSQLDNATRRHAKANPCELEFLTQWSAKPQAPWLDYIFKGPAEGGLGLACPVVMVHGNHEGFAHLEELVPADMPREPVRAEDLPTVDTNAHVRLLPSGWKVRTPSGVIVAGVGGIEPSQRRARYHPMAYLDQKAIARLRKADPVDILITHQGPSSTQGDAGSESLQALLDAGTARAWFHGHSIRDPKIVRTGRTIVVPLKDVAFQARGARSRIPGTGGWAAVDVGPREVSVRREDPSFLREYALGRWRPAGEGRLVAPPLARIAWRLGGR